MISPYYAFETIFSDLPFWFILYLLCKLCYSLYSVFGIARVFRLIFSFKQLHETLSHAFPSVLLTPFLSSKIAVVGNGICVRGGGHTGEKSFSQRREKSIESSPSPPGTRTSLMDVVSPLRGHPVLWLARRRKSRACRPAVQKQLVDDSDTRHSTPASSPSRPYSLRMYLFFHLPIMYADLHTIRYGYRALCAWAFPMGQRSASASSVTAS